MSKSEEFEAGKAQYEEKRDNPFSRGSDAEQELLGIPTTSIMTGDNPAGVTALEVEGLPEIGRQTVRAYRGKENVGVLKVRGGVAEHVAVPLEDRKLGIGTMLGRTANFIAGRSGGEPIKPSADRSEAGDAWAKKIFGKENLPKRRPHFVQRMELKDIE